MRPGGRPPHVPLPIAAPAAVRSTVRRELVADRPAVARLLGANAAAAAAGLLGPYLLGRIVDAVRATPGPEVLGAVDGLALLILLATVLQTGLTRAALLVGHRFGERAAARVRERFLGRVLDLPPAVADRLPTGDLLTRGTTDVTLVATTLRQAVPDVLVAAVQALLLLVAVLVAHPGMGACGLAGLAAAMVGVRWYLRRAPAAYLAEGAANAELAEVVAGTARGARTVEALGLAPRRASVAEAAIDEARRRRLYTLRLRTVLFPGFDLATRVPVAAALVVGGVLVAHDPTLLGTVVAALLYLRQLTGPLDTLLLWAEQLQSAAASFARVEGVADLRRGGPARPAAAEPVSEQIELRAATYSYDGYRDVLHGLDLVVRPGERLAVVGASGAGKTTMGRLLAGLDRPRRGAVTVGGVPVADLPPDRLRRHVVLVTQDHHVFADSLRSNLLLARPDADDDRLRRALAAVGAGWAAALPAGLDTVLGGDAGAETELDAAQAQQLSLARVVLADPHTVVLDEATARLDPATARRTERALAAVLRGRTVVAIAHRLHTARDADRVAVLDAGRLVELGHHDELVTGGGTYQRLWEAWRG